jgi:ankyrin repeat protein
VNNADVNAKDNLGRTCLKYAALTGDIQLVRLLEIHGSASTEGQTIASLHGGSRHRHVEISSSMDMDFHQWEFVDFQDVIT